MKKSVVAGMGVAFALACACAGAAELGFVDKLVRGTELGPVSVTENAAGHTVVDFGKHGFGWIEIDVATPGDYEFVWGEYLNAKGSVETDARYTSREGTIRCAVTKGRFDAAATGVRIPYAKGNGSSFWAAPVGKFGTVMPFRWLEVVKCPFAVTKANVRQVPIYYPYDMTEESFACDNANLMKVHDFCKHTIRATTYTGKFIDGDRERLPYEADSWITLMSTYAVTSDGTLSRPMVDYLATHSTWPTEWKQFFIRLVYEDWMHSGETDLVKKHYARMRDSKSWRFLRRPDGLLVTQGPGVRAAPDGSKPWDIVDWAMCYRDGFVFTNVNAVVNALHYRNLVELAAMARAIGETADAALFDAEARATFGAYQKVFYDPKDGCYADGEGTAHKTVQANAMALACGVVPPERVSRVADFVSRKGFTCSTYMAQFVLESLFRAGRADRAFELMTGTGERSWMAMMAKGATVTMEFWDLTMKEPGRIPDMNHAWSTAPLNMISRFVCGVEPAAPGWKRVSIRPNPGPLREIHGRIPTVRGTVRLDMVLKDGAWRASVDTPVAAHFAFRGIDRDLPAGRSVLAAER